MSPPSQQDKRFDAIENRIENFRDDIKELFDKCNKTGNDIASLCKEIETMLNRMKTHHDNMVSLGNKIDDLNKTGTMRAQMNELKITTLERTFEEYKSLFSEQNRKIDKLSTTITRWGAIGGTAFILLQLALKYWKF